VPGSSTAGRGLEILLAIAEHELFVSEGATVSAIAELAGIDKSQASRTLQALEDLGFLKRDPNTKRYRPGSQFFVAARGSGDVDLLTVARLELDRLANTLKETAYLSARRGSSIFTILGSAPNLGLRSPPALGTLVPITCTSAGRAILSRLSENEASEIARQAGGGCAGPNAPLTPQDVLLRCQEAYERGYAVAIDELEPGLTGIAAPVTRDAETLALNVSGPTFRLAPRVDEISTLVCNAAARISSP